MKKILSVCLLLMMGSICVAQTPQAPASGTGIRVTELPQREIRVTPGQYSGITCVGGDRYAVVDDKLPGGGIVFFDIPLREDGTVRATRVRRTVPEATRDAAGPSLDNEGVTFADGKLYVSAEKDQSIREYDLDGVATGVAFPVPADLGVGAIVNNGGFEALTYNASTGKFWTTTEFPLKKDTEIPRLHRLQRFGAGFAPDGRFLYQMDEPARPAAERGPVMAFVYGISALTALDDGRLIVLEREVYVPDGRPTEIVLDAFARVRLYVVDPSDAAGDPARILPKQLLCEFTTQNLLSALGIEVELANYEGMCLGPRLPDGRRTLVLIADSQGGMASLARKLGRDQLTRELVKVILLEGEGI